MVNMKRLRIILEPRLGAAHGAEGCTSYPQSFEGAISEECGFAVQASAARTSIRGGQSL